VSSPYRLHAPDIDVPAIARGFDLFQRVQRPITKILIHPRDLARMQEKEPAWAMPGSPARSEGLRQTLLMGVPLETSIHIPEGTAFVLGEGDLRPMMVKIDTPRAAPFGQEDTSDLFPF